MQYDFDRLIDRSNTCAVKLELLEQNFGSKNLIPLWIADMEFETPHFITEAIKKRLECPIYGYTMTQDSYYKAIIKWLSDQHQWKVEREWISFIPGVVRGLGYIINFFTKKGDKIIIQPPVYPPFHNITKDNERELVYNPLIRKGDTYEMDLEGLEKVIDDKCKLMIIANPHNPVGIVWSRETLAKLADICYKHNILVVSDEIHSDLCLWGNKHTPFASVSENARNNSITLHALSKTFNAAGLISSFAIVPNEKIRTPFYKWLTVNELNFAHLFAAIATEAAFTHGKDWLKQMLAYIEGNIEFVEKYFRENIPAIKTMRPQASFLIWLNCRDLGLSHAQVRDLFINKAGLALNCGESFGVEGQCFMRLNVGCPRSILEKALGQLKAAIGC